MSQFGGGRLGGVVLNPGGTSTQTFETLSHGPIERLLLTVSMALISTATAFNLVVSTDASAAAEGADDLDKVLDTLFSLVAIFFDAEHLVGVLKPSEWRTILNVLNKRDFDGSFLNGIQVPASGGSAKTVRVTIPIPVSLELYFQDGGIFRNGARRLSEGRIEYTCGASLTPTIVLANGSAAVSAVSISLTDLTGPGTEDDVGNFWSARKKPNLSTVYEVQDDLIRLAVLDATPATTSAVTNWNVGDYSLLTPADFQAKYQAEKLVDGGYDVTQRVTPLIWLEKNRTFLDFEAHLGKKPRIEAVAGVSSLTLYEVLMHPPAPAAIQRVSQKVASGGAVTMEHPTPKSLPPGSRVPPALVSMLPVRIKPDTGVRSPGAAPLSNPEAAAANVAKNQVATAQISKIQRLFRQR